MVRAVPPPPRTSAVPLGAVGDPRLLVRFSRASVHVLPYPDAISWLAVSDDGPVPDVVKLAYALERTSEGS